MSSVELVVASANRLGEGPVWSVEEQALYWVDSRAPAVFRFDPATGLVSTVPMPALIGSLALRRSGGLIAALQTGFHTLDFETGVTNLIVDPETELPENRFNDGRCDRQGRFWAGTMNDVRREPTGALYRLDANLRCTRIRGDLIVPNSIAWSPDDQVMFLADTYRHVIWAYDFSPSDGAIYGARTFVDAHNHPGRPDGSTVDADGCLWNAEYAGGRVVRYTPAGIIDRVVELPVSQPTSCIFGGSNLDVLYITTASQRLTPEQLADQPLAGGLFALQTNICGLPEPAFAG